MTVMIRERSSNHLFMSVMEWIHCNTQVLLFCILLLFLCIRLWLVVLCGHKQNFECVKDYGGSSIRETTILSKGFPCREINPDFTISSFVLTKRESVCQVK